MSDPQTIWAALIAAQAVVAVPFVLTLLKQGTPMSDAFKAALAALVNAFNAKISTVQNDLDTANQTISDLRAQLAALDAEATAEVTAVTPAA